MHKQPRSGKKERTFGHSWLVLAGPDRVRTLGHTGEFGIVQESYYEGVLSRIESGHPDPIGYLFEPMYDGLLEQGAGGHVAEMVVVFPLTPEQYDAVVRFIDLYKFRVFSLTEQQCSAFAAGAARAAGIDLGYTARCRLPREVRRGGQVIRLWTDPKYEVFTFGTPEVLELSLLEAARQGLGWRGSGRLPER